ncbi:DNA methyltransferase [Rhodococcoides fascians]|uniref:DNA methyltransferase n=1 Tax=Rhodococcoides fascians TaxID=1828 RepID=UPI00050BDEAE|nr:DNA methyltransferase [Rhodococcus fascians]
MSTKALSLAEIRTRIDAFVSEWADETSENAESQTFWNEFLNCFGISRRRVASFEKWATRASTSNKGRIDVFWPRVLIAEQKSAGAMKEDSAESQANDYLVGGDIGEDEYPRYIISSDFQTFRLTDLEVPPGEATITFPLSDLSKHVEDFAWIAGYQRRKFSTEAEAQASVEAANLMARLYVTLTGDADVLLVEEEGEEEDHSLAVSILLTRLLFLLFGDDAGLWEKGLFEDFVETRTQQDGSDMGAQLNSLFEILNTSEAKRSGKADETMLRFPYVNGDLFNERERVQYFDTAMREALIEACHFDWTSISPAVFGSLFQAIKSKAARRSDGEHYTTETNILKTIEPLFLDDLRSTMKAAWNSPKKLRDLHNTFADMRYFDPACGCGNFLIVAYREMRRIELELLVRLRELAGTDSELTLDGTWDLKVSLDQFYGIELNWWPAKIAETAMFLVDHQANREMALALGQAPERLPIKITAHIRHDNALQTDWKSFLPPADQTYVFGNPPFAGQKEKDGTQRGDLRSVWGKGYDGYLDYVTGWHAKTLDYFREHRGSWAFVTTNSITQGQPVGPLFRPIFAAGWRIKFAHRTFEWTSEATGQAAVHCVIVGFSRVDGPVRLFDYATVKSQPHEVSASFINAYLVDGPNLLIEKRMKPVSPGLPEVQSGSKAVDWGLLTFSTVEAVQEVLSDPVAAKYVRLYLGGDELINNDDRWCLWLEHLDPSDVSRSPLLAARIAEVKQKRLASPKAPTRRIASTPHLFGERRQPQVPYLGIPQTFSETRLYATARRLPVETIASIKLFTAADADGYLFAIVSSSMFITWQKTVGGRIKSDPSFSNTIVWNNLPLPPVKDATKARIIAAGKAIMEVREKHPDWSLAQHYNPLAMTSELVAAHQKLDGLVDRAFGASKTLTTVRERQALLFQRYDELANPLRIES